MIKKARTYLIIVPACVLIAAWVGQIWKVEQSGTWLCSGRYIMDHGHVQYDYVLAFWLIFDALLISAAYFGIPAIIQKVRTTREDITEPIDQSLKKFIGFIVMCGIGHLIDVTNIFVHHYYFAAGWHLATGIISIDTLLTLRKNASYFLNLPSRLFFEQYLSVSNEMQTHFNTGFWFLDVVTGALWWSDGAKRMYGKPKNWKPDLVEIDAMVTDENRPNYEKETKEHRVKGGEYSFVYEINVGNKVKVIRAGINELRDEDGELLQIYGYIKDVTTPSATADDLIRANEKLPYQNQLHYLKNSLVTIQSRIDQLRIQKLTQDGRSSK